MLARGRSLGGNGHCRVKGRAAADAKSKQLLPGARGLQKPGGVAERAELALQRLGKSSACQSSMSMPDFPKTRFTFLAESAPSVAVYMPGVDESWGSREK